MVLLAPLGHKPKHNKKQITPSWLTPTQSNINSKTQSKLELEAKSKRHGYMRRASIEDRKQPPPEAKPLS